MDKTIWALCFLGALGLTSATPLDDYVNKPDDTYSYKEIRHDHFDEYDLYILNMTSQTWKSDAVSDRSVWWHYLCVTIPANVRNFSTAFMLIDGGSQHDAPPKSTDNFVALTSMFAVATGSIGADLKQIPNQPIVFKDDPTHKSRSEDAIIAWTWRQFVVNNPDDPEILLRLPMTKASVRAMDTIHDFAKKKIAQMNVDKFMIAGASKRGWTTWTTAAVDKRVIAACPIVMDLLNMVPNLHHHFRAYGGWTFAFEDYYSLNFTAELDSENVKKMAAIIDPISYKDRLTMPKLVSSTGGDEFFLPDDSHYYLKEMEGPMYLRMVPNAEHSLAGHEISLFFTLRAFYLTVIHGKALPVMTWERLTTAQGGSITLKTDRPPTTIDVYHAKTLDGSRRDFRLLVSKDGKPYPHPVVWLRTSAKTIGENMFEAEFDNPPEGWVAFFIQVTFPGPEGTALEFTTETQIIPDTFPFPECHGADCLGTLV